MNKSCLHKKYVDAASGICEKCGAKAVSTYLEDSDVPKDPKDREEYINDVQHDFAEMFARDSERDRLGFLKDIEELQRKVQKAHTDEEHVALTKDFEKHHEKFKHVHMPFEHKMNKWNDDGTRKK